MQSAAWLVNFIRNEAAKACPSGIFLAELVSGSPFRIRLSGVELGNPFLLVTPALLAAASGNEPEVKPGDMILVLGLDNQQQYVAVSKVVKS
ncbi:hypothetical protein [Paenibacillus sp. YN15]|uniref:hypothetical protein n=1 Tax=Paenibacillus sp. YN15 TaxID=1742774 RepID=UPI000DCC0F17|nr:hypothetical protein [Paenibacillus sp. YN15]RAU93213.1 hypothetical protein DQG13_26165 [Paenibacillus sp. YN15]